MSISNTKKLNNESKFKLEMNKRNGINNMNNLKAIIV